MLDPLVGLVVTIARHVLVDAAIVVCVVCIMHWRGIPVERLEELVTGWIRRVQQMRVLQRFKRSQTGLAAQKMGKDIYKNVGNMSGLRTTR